MRKEVWLAGGTRTAIGGFRGSLAEVPAPRLGSIVIRTALDRAGVAADRVDDVLFGNVIGAGLGQNVARQAAIGAGIPSCIGATTVNKVCGSGLEAVIRAAQAIQCGDADLVVAGGTENMSAAPYLLPGARDGYRLGHGQLVDAMICDGLWDAYNDIHMGTCGDCCAEACGISRQEQDDFAVASYQRAIQAERNGWFRDEIVPVETDSRQGPAIVDRDAEPARFDEQKLRLLKPAFAPDGTVTAGNASTISDGAAAIVVVAQPRAVSVGVMPQARILGYAAFAREPERFPMAPFGAIGRLLKQLSLRVEDVDLFEINEAFSLVPLAAMKELQIPHERVNVYGGAVSLGHPLGASGTRILVTLLSALKQRNAQRGIAALCIGGGEALAIAVERVGTG